MDQSKIRSQLKIQPVEMKHVAQYNELLRYVFQVTNSELEESGYEEGELVKAKRPILKNAFVIGWFNDEQLISQLSIYPSEVNIHGKIFSMGGLTGVGTYPEYANMGLMRDLIERGLVEMRAKKQLISYLYPYSIPYYRNKGWEIMSDHISFKMKDSQVPEKADVKGFVERLNVSDEDVLALYDRYARSRHGALIRGEQEWDEYWRWENEDERIAAIYYDENDVAQGVIFYWIADDVFHIKDFLYLNQEARKGLWNFISAHDSMLDEVHGNIYTNEPLSFFLEDGQIIETIEPYFMARIVDVYEFLKEYPFRKINNMPDLHFVVTDPVASWNNGIFSIHQTEKGDIEIGKEVIGTAIQLDLQTLTCMLMSYKRPNYLLKIERLNTDEETVKILQQIIPSEQPYFSDYF